MNRILIAARDRRVLIAAAAVLVVAIGVTVWAVWGRSYPRLHTGISGDGTAGVIYHDVAPGQPTTLGGDFDLCVDGEGTIQIERIESRDPFGGLRLDAFAVAPVGGQEFTSQHRSIAEIGHPVTVDATLEGSCVYDDDGDVTAGSRLYTLLLQFSRPGAQSAGNHGITIWYRSDGRTRSATANYEVALCQPGDNTTRECTR
jgi:hypothetical protein